MAGCTTILAVDDDDDVRALIRDVLSPAGFRVLEAASGEAALQVLETDEPVDLIVTDMVMPGINGMALARYARRLRPGMRILFASGYWSHIVTAPAPREFVRKPYRPGQLLARVKRSLAEPAADQAPS
jgi:two-component system, cell cycle sensor histidine kinase and response regulator CckA